jgi:ankyrin repeat protein
MNAVKFQKYKAENAINYLDSRCSSWLIFAVRNGRLDVVIYLLSLEEYDLAIWDGYMLQIAAFYGHLDIVMFLVPIKGCSLSTGGDYWFALRWAVQCGHFSILRYLVSMNCDGSYPEYLISMAGEEGDIEIIRYLLSIGCKYSSTQHKNFENQLLGDACKYLSFIFQPPNSKVLAIMSDKFETFHGVVMDLACMC